MKLKLSILATLSFFMSSCATGPDSSPEVTAQAMSYNGDVPILTAKGSVTGSQHVGSSNRKTMLHE